MSDKENKTQVTPTVPNQKVVQTNEAPFTRNQTPLYSYTCHPAKRNKYVTFLVTLFCLVLMVMVWMIAQSVLLTGLGVLILFGSLAPFYMPTHYSFFDDGFAAKTTAQTIAKQWSQYRSYYPDKNGVLLSPFTQPSRLENFRGYYIKFSANKEKVMEIITSKIDFKKDDTE